MAVYEERKVKGITVNKYSEYIVRLNYLGQRWAPKNFTKLYGCYSLKETENKVREFKEMLDRGENPFDDRRFDDYMQKYFDGLKPTTAYIYKKAYDKYAKPILGYKEIKQISQTDIENVYKDMIDSETIKSQNSLKKMRQYLSPTFKRLMAEGKITKDYLALAEMPKVKNHTELSSLNLRLNDQSFKIVAQKLYKGIQKIKHDGIRNHLLLTLMTMRRPSEIRRTTQHDIINDVVFAYIERTKSSIDERYILPTEILEYLKSTDKEYPFRADEHACGRAWHKILKDENITFRQQFRIYDSRHLFTSLMSKKFNRDLVGACISHYAGDTNAVYQSFEFDDRKDVYRAYWELLRGKQ